MVGRHISHTLAFVLALTVFGAFLSASYVYASTITFGTRGRVVKAWLAGWLVFTPVPILVLAFVLPALAWLAALRARRARARRRGLGVRASFRRAWQLARADYVHALGSLATLAIVVILTQSVLAFLLRGAAGAALETAFALANVVISPLLFIGASLLYVDQAARVE